MYALLYMYMGTLATIFACCKHYQQMICFGMKRDAAIDALLDLKLEDFFADVDRVLLKVSKP